MRYYDAEIKIAALAAAKTVLYITVPANKLVTLVSSGITDASNVTNQQLEATWQKVTTLGTPTGTTLTPAKHDLGDSVAGSTVVGNVTASEPTYTANTDLGHDAAPMLSGWYFPMNPLPVASLPVFTGGDTWGLRMLSTPTAFDAIIRVTFGEQG